VHEPEATSWDGVTGAWWDDQNTDQQAVSDMVSRSLRRLTNESSDIEAWDALFRHFNRERSLGDVGYQQGESIAIKINMNQNGNTDWRADAGLPSPHLMKALLTQLIEVVEIPGDLITVYDASRYIGDPIYAKVRSGPDTAYQDIRFVVRPRWAKDGRMGAVCNETDPVLFSNPETPPGPVGYLCQSVVEADYLINLALLRAHTICGVTLCAKNHFGSVYFDGDGWVPSCLHPFVKGESPMGTYNSLVELMGHAHLGGKTLLYLIDGLYPAAHQGAPVMRFASFNDDWCSSLFASQDPVAVDSVALDFIRNEPRAVECSGVGVDNYLHEAALADDPPSGVVYDPEGDGTPLQSLGVHEHWNNPADMQYSRNLGMDEGIELIALSSDTAIGAADLSADGHVDYRDLQHLVGAWLTSPDCERWNVSCDLYADGYVDFYDWAYFAQAWCSQW
jgi:hypothetical protein